MPKHARILALGVAAFAIPAAIMLPTVPKALAATCSGNGCDGKDPAATGCNSGTITAKQSELDVRDQVSGSVSRVGTIQLRYNPTCRTAWARMLITPLDYRDLTNATYKAEVTRNSNGNTESCSTLTLSVTDDAYECYTPQLYDGGTTSSAWGGIIYANVHYQNSTGSY